VAKIVLQEFLTLDGVMQGPGGVEEDPSGGFDKGGWQQAYPDATLGGFVLDGLSGAGGYLLKTAHGSELIDAIHSVSRGDVVLHPQIAAKLVRARAAPQQHQQDAASLLSTREVEILRLAAQGLRNKDIARELALSIRTVEGHLSNVFAKIGVSSRTEAILFALSRGWFTLE